MKLYSHHNAANNRHIIKHREKIYTKIWRWRYDDNYSDDDDA